MPDKSAIYAVTSMAIVTLAVLCVPASAQERWAAIAPNNEASSTVVWATTKDQAKRNAIDACKDVSSTCASTPASTNDMSHVFAIMCCTSPKLGCAVSVAESRKSALSQVKRTMSQEDYSDCKLKNYIKAGTGEKS